MTKSVFLSILGLFVITRLFLISVAFTSTSYADYRWYGKEDEVKRYGRLATIFRGWDSDWYLEIATNGYPKMKIDSTTYFQQSVYAFYPLYPLDWNQHSYQSLVLFPTI